MGASIANLVHQGASSVHTVALPLANPNARANTYPAWLSPYCAGTRPADRGFGLLTLPAR